MRKLTKTLSQLSGGFDEEDQRLLNPDEKPEELDVSLSQLRHLTEVVFYNGLLVKLCFLLGNSDSMCF